MRESRYLHNFSQEMGKAHIAGLNRAGEEGVVMNRMFLEDTPMIVVGRGGKRYIIYGCT